MVRKTWRPYSTACDKTYGWLPLQSLSSKIRSVCLQPDYIIPSYIWGSDSKVVCNYFEHKIKTTAMFETIPSSITSLLSQWMLKQFVESDQEIESRLVVKEYRSILKYVPAINFKYTHSRLRNYLLFVLLKRPVLCFNRINFMTFKTIFNYL